MRKTFQFLLMFAVGAVCGGFMVDKRADHSREAQLLFSRKLKCQNLAAKYAQENTSEAVITDADRSDYSPARSSCIGAFTVMVPRYKNTIYSVRDMVTGEDLFDSPCDLVKGNAQSCQLESNKGIDEAFRCNLESADSSKCFAAAAHAEIDWATRSAGHH